MQGIIGGILFFCIGYFFSENRQKINWKKIFYLFLSQLGLAWLFLFSFAQKGFDFLAKGAQALNQALSKGTGFVFGYLGGAQLPFELNGKGTAFIFIFQALPMIVLMSAISMLLFHWRILPFMVRHISKVAEKTWCIGGALATGMAAKLFFGQTDAPLLIRPYIEKFSRNELFSMMTTGMATMSAALFILCTIFLEKFLGYSQALGHILTAAVINIPAALIMAELLIPENKHTTKGTLKCPYTFTNAMEAISQGTSDGWAIMWSIAAIIIVALAFVEIANMSFMHISAFFVGHAVPLQNFLGYVFWPFAWCIGIGAKEALTAGYILSLKIIFNEIVALSHVAQLPLSAISAKNIGILVYSTCGFGNVSSIAIQIAGFGLIAPTRKSEIISLAPKALAASVLAGGLSSALMSLMIK
jgi:CNT family concentrative nucleoside transporter